MNSPSRLIVHIAALAMVAGCASPPAVIQSSPLPVAQAATQPEIAPALEWRTDKVGGSSPFYEVIDTSAAGRTLTLRHMLGGGVMNNQFGTATARAPAAGMSGQRVTIRAEIRTQDAEAATLWVRAEGLGKTLRLENNMEHPIFGSSDWTAQTAVLDLPEGTERIAYGLLLIGPGAVSARNITVTFAPPTGGARTGLALPPEL